MQSSRPSKTADTYYQTLLQKWHDWISNEQQLTFGDAFQYIWAMLLAYVIASVVYNLYLHPLRKYPGPFWARASLWWRFYHSVGGRWHRVLESNHKRYGDVLRVSPNELSFATADAWRAIYAPRGKGGVAKIPKGRFYEVLGAGLAVPSVGSERNPILAAQKRELFADAFSVKGLAMQESVIQKNVDRWVAKLGKLGASKKGIDMSQWSMYLGFDLAGEMSFGESFGCVEREASHELLDLFLGLFLMTDIGDNLRRLPFADTLAGIVPSKWTNGIRDKIVRYVKDKTTKRLQRTEWQHDFLDNVVQKVHNGEVSAEEMSSHALGNTIAGGETTGTTMAATLFYLLKTPGVQEKLRKEVRSTFEKYEDINYASAKQLPYLMAVLKEGMRIFPPASQGFPRESPGVTVAGHYVPKDTEMYISTWTVSHDERYFDEPYTFRPERWIDPGCKDNKDASQPFYVGPRACLGKLFAYAQMSLQLAKVVYLYDMELIDSGFDWEPMCRIHFLWWTPQLNVRFRPRSD